MARKQYSGYRAYDYLEPTTDYQAFKLAAELDRVPSQKVSISPEEEQRVQRLLEEHVVISLHDHPIVMPEQPEQIFEQRRTGRDVTGYEGLSVSGLDAVFDNLMDGTALVTSRSGWKWDDIIVDLGMRLCDIAHQDMIIRAERVDDIRRAKANGQIALVPSLEAATPIENELDRLDILYGLGIRQSGIAYSEANTLGSGLKEPGDGGLTQFGRQAVRRMNKLGIAIDISHSGDRTSMDTIEVSDKPIFITHVGARALWNTPRMKPDEIFQACAAKGGVIGIEAAPHTTLTAKHPRHSIESFMEHFEYIANLVGIEHVAFGPDSFYGDHVDLHHAMTRGGTIDTGKLFDAGDVEFERVAHVDGMENPSESFRNITSWLVGHGYSDDEIQAVLGGNILRLLEEVWA
jgi:membrane dipeptidase